MQVQKLLLFRELEEKQWLACEEAAQQSFKWEKELKEQTQRKIEEEEVSGIVYWYDAL